MRTGNSHQEVQINRKGTNAKRITYMHNRERSKQNFFSKIDSEYAENVYNVERNADFFLLGGELETLGERIFPHRFQSPLKKCGFIQMPG